MQRMAEKRRSEELYAATKAQKAELQRAKREKIERLWRITMKKVTLEPPSADYYENSPLQPGISFFTQFLTNAKHSAAGLPLRIPEMLVVGHSIVWVKSEETAQGPVLQVTNDFRIGEFHRAFPREKSLKRPVAILRVPGDRTEDLKAMPLNFEELSTTLNASKLPSLGLVQRYIHCHSDKLAVTRLFYYAQSDANISPYAFALTASKSAAKHPYGDWILLAEQPGAVDVFPISGVALNRVVKDAQTVVFFLQSAYGVRIKCLVLDFLRDSQDRFWLLGCKGLLLEPSSLLAKAFHDKQMQEMSASELESFKHDRLNEQQSSIHCKLCLMPYKPTEMTHVLPFKMLLLFKLHTAHRGRQPFDLAHLRVNTMDFLSHWVRLCEICYLLVLNECELMEIELKLAEVLHIPTKVPDVMNEPEITQPNFMPHHLHQWRILLYFRDMEFIRANCPKRGLYLQYTLLGERFSYPLQAVLVDGKAKYHLTRLHYFFAVTNSEVLRFAQSCEAQFRLTKGQDWDRVLAQGVCHPLSSFTCNMHDNDAICQPFEILLFDSDLLLLRLHVVVGLARDREVKVHEMPISIYRQHGLFLPEPAYINSEPLPQVWIEAFTKQYEGLERTEVLDSSAEIEEMYSPQLVRKEIYAQPLSSTHVLHTDVDLDPFPRPPRPTLSATLRPKSSLPVFLHPIPSFKPKSNVPKALTPISPSRPSLSTTASFQVLYQRHCHLLSPAFVSPRSRALPAGPQTLITSDSYDALFPEQEKAMSERELKDTIATFLRKREREELKPRETARFTERSTKPSLGTERKRRKHRRAKSGGAVIRRKTQEMIAAYAGSGKGDVSV